MNRRAFAPCAVGLAVGLALITAPAVAGMAVNGCRIVTHPSPNHATDCPGGRLGGANLGSADLRTTPTSLAGI